MIIFKYDISPEFVLDLPSDAEILSVKLQRGLPKMWVMLNPSKPKVRRKFRSFPTGFEFSFYINLKFIDTFVLEPENLVFHVFEEIL